MTEQTQREEGRQELEKFIGKNQTLLIAVVPLVIYLIFAIYRIGYYSYFNIPREWISINLSEVLRSIDIFINTTEINPIISLAVFCLFLFIKSHDGIAESAVFGILFFGLIILQKIYLAAFFQTLERILGAIVFVIIGLVLFVLMPTLTKQKGYVHKIKFLFTRPFGEKFGAYKYWIIVGIIFFSYTLFSDAGYYSAAKQKAFYVVNTDPETVMLEVNDDLALCFRFDRDRKIVGNEFTIVDVSNREELVYTYEEVGPLKIEDLTNYGEILPGVTPPTPDNTAHP